MRGSRLHRIKKRKNKPTLSSKIKAFLDLNTRPHRPRRSPGAKLRASSSPTIRERGQTALFASAKSAKTNPLNPMFTGNRHERRSAKGSIVHQLDEKRPIFSV